MKVIWCWTIFFLKDRNITFFHFQAQQVVLHDFAYSTAPNEPPQLKPSFLVELSSFS